MLLLLLLQVQNSETEHKGTSAIKKICYVYLIAVNTLEGSIELVLGDILDDLGDLTLVIDEEETLENVLDLLDRDRVDKGSVEHLRDGRGKSLHCCFCE